MDYKNLDLGYWPLDRLPCNKFSFTQSELCGTTNTAPLLRQRNFTEACLREASVDPRPVILLESNRRAFRLTNLQSLPLVLMRNLSI
ncbi:hypothetical protein CDAR_212031 [Caerostris darwini]|uniref:Uncharacterized protein n=1 Tax=Caerostris darwini TaxID=1538125 RepID=A0AAV4NRZ3_9ARAC|nr:hypothetical protein CDAR_212031 [Caerostris darwini]